MDERRTGRRAQLPRPNFLLQLQRWRPRRGSLEGLDEWSGCVKRNGELSVSQSNANVCAGESASDSTNRLVARAASIELSEERRRADNERHGGRRRMSFHASPVTALETLGVLSESALRDCSGSRRNDRHGRRRAQPRPSVQARTQSADACEESACCHLAACRRVCLRRLSE